MAGRSLIIDPSLLRGLDYDIARLNFPRQDLTGHCQLSSAELEQHEPSKDDNSRNEKPDKLEATSGNAELVRKAERVPVIDAWCRETENLEQHEPGGGSPSERCEPAQRPLEITNDADVPDHRAASEEPPSTVFDYILIILQAIEETQNDPALLRSLVYGAARHNLTKIVVTNYRQLGGSQQYMQHRIDLETAINQVENLSQEQQKLAKGDKVRLLDQSISSPESTAVTVRDSLADTIFEDAWANNTSVVVRDASGNLTGDARGNIEILRPSEFWEPAFGRGAKSKRTRADFWWGVQLASAAIIGVVIYAVMLAGSDVFFSRFDSSQAASMSQGLAVASIASNTVRPNVPRRDHGGSGPTLGFPLPSVYGVYAVSAGKLYELDQLAIRVPDARVRISAMISEPSHVTIPDGKLGFVIYRRDLAASAPIETFVRVVAEVEREMKFRSGASPTVADISGQWAVRSKSYEYRVAPVDDNPEMIVLHPQEPQLTLSPGRYALVLAGQGFDFTVAGRVTDTAHCLERTDVVGGAVYSECRTAPANLVN